VGSCVIHCEPRIQWQAWRAGVFRDGLERIGFNVSVTSDRFRHDEGFPILLGTTFWRDIERDGGEFLLVDRCSFGDTNKFVSLVWNGHGKRGDHRTPETCDPSRWERHGVDLVPWREGGDRVVLCGQTESYSPEWPSLEGWYRAMRATHFKRHPAGINPSRFEDTENFENCGLAITLNSSVGVQCVLNGIPTQCWDPGAMAWDVSGHRFGDAFKGDRLPWCHWLAWTQWSDDEIREGIPWAYQL
jgi:hypothetical protein